MILSFRFDFDPLCNVNRYSVETPVSIPSPALRGFWWYRISVLGCFGSQASTKKKLYADFEQLFRAFFSCFRGPKKNPIASAIKNCIIPYLWILFFNLFLPQKTWKNSVFLGLCTFSNLSVLYKSLSYCRTGYLDWGLI